MYRKFVHTHMVKTDMVNEATSDTWDFIKTSLEAQQLQIYFSIKKCVYL